MPRVPAHQVITRNLGAAYPFIAEAGLGQRGVMIGDDLLGGSFVFDPFELYAMGAVSNPKELVRKQPIDPTHRAHRDPDPTRAACHQHSLLRSPGWSWPGQGRSCEIRSVSESMACKMRPAMMPS